MSGDATDEEVVRRAEERKNAGNAHFKAGNYSEALDDYSAAIGIHCTAAYLSNRAFTFIKLEKFGAAIEDATAAINMDPSFVKVGPAGVLSKCSETLDIPG